MSVEKALSYSKSYTPKPGKTSTRMRVFAPFSELKMLKFRLMWKMLPEWVFQ